MFGHHIHEDPYHITVVRQHLTRNLASTFPEMYQELCAAFDDYIPATVDGLSFLVKFWLGLKLSLSVVWNPCHTSPAEARCSRQQPHLCGFAPMCVYFVL